MKKEEINSKVNAHYEFISNLLIPKLYLSRLKPMPSVHNSISIVCKYHFLEVYNANMLLKIGNSRALQEVSEDQSTYGRLIDEIDISHEL